MAGFRNEGFSGRLNEVDSSGNMDAGLPLINSQAGMMGIGAIVHDGAAGAARVVRAAEVSINRRVRLGLDTLWFQDEFSYTAQNTAVWNNSSATAAFSYASGYCFLNSASATGTTWALTQTYKYFPILGDHGLTVEFDANVPQATVALTTVELGMFQAVGSGSVLDGVLFRINNGTLTGVINYNGTETTVALGSEQTYNTTNSYQFRIEQNLVEFWVNNVLLGIINNPSGQPMPCSTTHQPISARTMGTSGSVAASLKLGSVRAFVNDVYSVRPWAQVMAGLGGMGSQIQAGDTLGRPDTAYMANSLSVGAGLVLNNTTQATYRGLGGQFDVQPTLAANNDGILCWYQCPSGTYAVPGKSLIITGIQIQGIVTSALTNAGPVLLMYSLAYGSTSLTLANAEGAAAKAYRRVPIGIENYGGGTNVAVGVLGRTNGPLLFVPNSPICVHPGEYVTIAVKNVGTVTSAGVITILVTFDSHWE